MGYILPWNEGNDLEDILKKVIDFAPKAYISRKDKIINFLRNYIDSKYLFKINLH
jgi:hypothetical protein